MAETAENVKAAPAARKAPRVAVEPVVTPDQRDEFLHLPNRIHAGDPNYVPPLEMERRDFLDTSKNPFFKHAEPQLFLAHRDGKIVGRVAACVDRNYNSFHDTKIGWFGFYEAIDDDEVALSLYEAARSWLRSRGMTLVMGPASFTSNHEWGALVEGFDSPPVVMMPYNPRYYVRHFEEVMGLKKEKDLFAWWMSAMVDPPEKVVRIAEKVRQKEEIVVRPLDLKDFAGETRRIKEIYNAAWEKNWGFVPFTDDEFEHTAKDLKMLAVPELLLMAEVRGEPVAFSMTLPDFNQVFIKVGGRLTTWGLPIGLAKLLWYQRKVDQLRLITLGIKEQYRKRGIDAILYLDTLRTARRLGYKGGEISWTLEDNVLVNRAIEMMGGNKYKTYRVYTAEV